MQSKRKHRRGRFTGLLAIALTMLSAVIWSKLRLVGGLPRSVYAEPDQGVDAPKESRKNADVPHNTAHD
ncbi:MAG: hypothetical protein AAGB51_12755 [Planctomycetota bacterium]